MKTAIYSQRAYELPYQRKYNNGKHELIGFDAPLSLSNAHLCAGCKAVSLFITDDGSEAVLDQLKKQGIEHLILRSAGYDHIACSHAQKIGLSVYNSPQYAPNAIAEHAVALLLTLGRKIIQADQGVKRNDFSVDQLAGIDISGETVGIIGTGKIGSAFAQIMKGFGARILAYDVIEHYSLFKYYGVKYTTLDQLLRESSIVSLHIPLNQQNHHFIGASELQKMQKGALLINTGRGALIDTAALIEVIESGQLGGVGLDVYEFEKGLFLKDRSQDPPKDPFLDKLRSFQNVLITPHQGFLTNNGLRGLSRQLIETLDQLETTGTAANKLYGHE